MVLWNELTRIIRASQTAHIMIIGDFNAVLSQSKRENYEYNKSDSKLFSEFIKSNDLCVVPLVNAYFT